MRIHLIILAFVMSSMSLSAQLLTQKEGYTHADTLRGSVTLERAWWNALHYDLHVTFNDADSTLSGFNTIRYQVLNSHNRMQIDLMRPLKIDSIVQNGKRLQYKQDGNAYIVNLIAAQPEKQQLNISVYYHGKPQVAAKPPWDGGVIWAKDAKGRPWISVACQGLGSSVWYPCKDHQYDEPDSASIHIAVPTGLTAVSNGRLKSKKTIGESTIFEWTVVSPINDYNLIPYIGHYTDFHETYKGEKGNLDVGYYVLDYNLSKANGHLSKEVNRMLKDLEYWFGPYPFYEDGYKIVDAPHLGMEHQSAIAYGNRYQNGYLNRDLSGSGWGLKWDFIVVHESAHEWFGNNISTKELADMWVHESFANYSETLFTEREYGKVAGTDYIVGSRKGIDNDVPIIGVYNVNEEGSGDMYPKGGNMIHTIRQVIDNDEKFRQILRGLNKEFYHQTVTTGQIETYISQKSGIDFSRVFDQYLRTIKIPVLVWSLNTKHDALTYRWQNVVDGFDLPLKIQIGKKAYRITPTTENQTLKITPTDIVPVQIVDRNFYVKEKIE